MPSKKKKSSSSKSASNPARGFATTSVASKSKSEQQQPLTSPAEAAVSLDIPKKESSHNTPKKEGKEEQDDDDDDGNDAGVTLPLNSKHATLREANKTPGIEEEEEAAAALKDLTPEQLEQRLYTAELQSLVEKFSAKTTRDASRTAGRWSTEVRVLRASPATHPLSLASLRLTGDEKLVHQIVDAAREDVSRGLFWYSSLSNVTPPSPLGTARNEAGAKKQQPAVLAEEDAVAKMWAVQRALAALGFEDTGSSSGHDVKMQQEELMRFLQQNAATIDANVKSLADPSLVWGLEEALDWLVLHGPKDALPIYDSLTGKPRRVKTNGRDTTPAELPEAGDKSMGAMEKVPAESSKHESGNANEEYEECDHDNEQEDENVSDLESDLEPDDLLAAYIETKSRLYRIDPDRDRSTSLSKKASSKKPSDMGGLVVQAAAKNRPPSRVITKLHQKLKQIESDILFDRRDADMKWKNQRILLARELAEKSRQGKANEHISNSAKRSSSESDAGLADTEEEEDESGDDDEDDDDGDDAIAALFSSLPSDAPVKSTDSTTVTIRDFGRSKGISPRRVLEETCRARDPGVRFVYKLVSRTAFSHRHSVTVNWSKPQDISISPYEMSAMSSSSAPADREDQFTMVKVATPDAQQSEAFVSTFALFQLFSESPREEKSYMRLPPIWRNLWFEFTEQKKGSTEKEERHTVETLRAVYRSCMNVGGEEHRQGEEDDVVLIRNFKNRAAGHKSSAKPEEEAKEERAGKSNSNQNGTADEEEQLLKDLWTEKSSTSSYRKMLQIREQLPMYRFKKEALAAVESNQVTIICGETGCGKSTQMPSFILENELSRGRACRVYCTEPRRISAITLAQRVSEEMGENSKRDLGTVRSLVGYAIRLESKVAATTRLVYATTGIVLRMLESPAGGFDEISHIIIDEVHERSIETDFLLIILRSLMAKRPSLKIILMSATVDATKFAKYFGGAPVLTVPGRTFPVETKFLEDAVELTKHIVEDEHNNRGMEEDDDLVELEMEDPSSAKGGPKISNLQQYSAKTRSTLSKMNEYRIDYDLIVKLIEQIGTNEQYKKFSKAILVFLPGIAEIRRLHDMISGTGFAKRFIVHSLHSSIASEDQQNAFAVPSPGMSKIVLSTNIAETGVTIPDVTCVIDAGKHKEMRFDERRQISRLIESFISRANAKQRRGRAGRVQEGLCFHLFTKSRHDEAMAEQQTPEMLRLSLQDLVMRVKICKLGDIQTVLAQALDPPLAKNIQRAIDALIEVGALTSGQELTLLGKQLSKLPLDPYLGKLVLFGAVFGCLDISLTLAAILTSKSPFVASVNSSKAAADAARASFQKGQSDLLTEFNAYASWRRVCTTGSTPEHQFCRKSFLSVTTLCNIEDLKAQLLSSVADAGFLRLSGNERSALSKIHNSSASRRQRSFVDTPAEHNANTDNLLAAESVIAWSFYPKLLVRDGKGWRNVSNSSTIALHPTSIVRQQQQQHQQVAASSSPSFHGVRYLSFYSITKSAGAKHPLAQYLHPITPLPLLLLAGADANFHPLARVVSLDGARLRFSLEAEDWEVFVALKYFRARMEEIARRRWKNPSSTITAAAATAAGRNNNNNIKDDDNDGEGSGGRTGTLQHGQQLLSRWWALWEALLDATAAVRELDR